MAGYDPLKLAEKLRPKMIDLENKKVLLAVLANTEQQQDLTEDRFWEGIFRSKIYTKPGDLDVFKGEPAGVASKKLTASTGNEITPQECNTLFLGQINGCNLRCWYCYVDSVCNSANPKYGKFFSAEEYLTHFLIESRKHQNSTDLNKRLNVLRISGGEVFLVPEIIFWIVEAIEKFKLENHIYVWVECNLASGDFYWRHLSPEQRQRISKFKNLGVCVCHKGFDQQTFNENTGAAPEFFDRQFQLHRRLIEEDLDVYSYLYPITVSADNLRGRIVAFMDRLQREVDYYAPLRMATPPIKVYGPTKKRLDSDRERALENQHCAIAIWNEELCGRFGTRGALIEPHNVPVGAIR